MSDVFIAEIRILPYTFAPMNWATCQGGLLQISQNTALFSLIGITYGGDGRVTMALPDLSGRSPMNQGQGPGLYDHRQGGFGGYSTITLTVDQIPSHSHGTMMGNPEAPTKESATPVNRVSYYSNSAFSNRFYYRPPAGTGLDAPMSESAISPAGGGHAHENRQPYLAVQFCMALDGTYPSRN